MKKEMLKVVLVRPGERAEITELADELSAIQKMVDGYFETICPFSADPNVILVCNEEAKIREMPYNRIIYGSPKQEEISYAELTKRFREIERAEFGGHLTGFVTISNESFEHPYPLEARTYIVSSDNKAFQPNMGGYSIFASSLDGSDPCIRIERYLKNEKGGKDGWEIERCYMEERGKPLDIIAGAFFICGTDGENFASLTNEQALRYERMFRHPEVFKSMRGEEAGK